MSLIWRNRKQNVDVPYTVPASMPDSTLGGTGGGNATLPETLFRTVLGPLGQYNVGLSNWKAYHYGERALPGRSYGTYIPPRGFSEWLR